jgi:hypothetical protein
MKKLTGSLFSLLFLASCASDAYTIDEDIPTVLNPIENDSDIDGDPLTITNAHASHGQVTLGENNTLGFKLKPDFNGTDKVFYTLADASFGNGFFPGSTVANAYTLDNADVPVDTEIDSQGRVVIAGTIDNSNLGVTRFLPDGRIDLDFGRQGSSSILHSVDIDNNGQTLVAKFLSNGALDTAGFNAGVGYQVADVDTKVDDNFEVLFDVSVADNCTI